LARSRFCPRGPLWRTFQEVFASMIVSGKCEGRGIKDSPSRQSREGEMAKATSISFSKFTESVQAAVKAAVAKHPKFKIEPLKETEYVC
jgi:hypothetical protein